MEFDIEDSLRASRNMTQSPESVPDPAHRSIACRAFDQFERLNVGVAF